jgi:hypothetical protein
MRPVGRLRGENVRSLVDNQWERVFFYLHSAPFSA